MALTDSHMGEFSWPQSVISSINDLDFRPDLVIFATKLVSSFDASRYSVSLLEGVPILLIQNGIFIEHHIKIF